eukprot:gene7185-9653_t
MGSVLGVGDIVRAQVTAQIVTCVVFSLVYANYIVWKSYLQVVFWAFLLSQALRPMKWAILKTIKDLRQENIPQSQRKSLPDAFQEFVLGRIWTSAAEGYNDRGRRHAIFGTFVNNSFVFLAAILLFVIAYILLGYKTLLGIMLLLIVTIYTAARLLDQRLLDLCFFLCSDNTIVTLLLTTGSVCLVGFVIFVLGIASLSEGVQAVEELYGAVSTYIQENDEYMQKSWSDISSKAYTAYNHDNNLYYQLASLLPFRWCAVNNIEVALVSGSNITTAMQDSRLCLQNVYGTESWWDIADSLCEIGIRQYSAPLRDSGLVTSVINLFFGIARTVASISEFSSQLLVFCIFFFEFTSADVDLLATAVCVLVPASPYTRQRVISESQAVISAAFYIPFSLASLHALTTLLVTTILDIRFPFFATFLSFIVTLIPITNPLAIPITWAAASILRVPLGSWEAVPVLKNCSFLIVCIYTYSYANRLVLEQQHVQEVTGNPVLTLFSVLLGCYAFGIAGFILGPLVLYLLMMVVRLMTSLSKYFTDLLLIAASYSTTRLQISHPVKMKKKLRSDNDI